MVVVSKGMAYPAEAEYREWFVLPFRAVMKRRRKKGRSNSRRASFPLLASFVGRELTGSALAAHFPFANAQCQECRARQDPTLPANDEFIRVIGLGLSVMCEIEETSRKRRCGNASWLGRIDRNIKYQASKRQSRDQRALQEREREHPFLISKKRPSPVASRHNYEIIRCIIVHRSRA
jgi:hypothetical protein